MSFRLRFKFKPHEPRIGGLWWLHSPRRDPLDEYDYAEFKFVVNVLPMLPVVMVWQWGGGLYRGED